MQLVLSESYRGLSLIFDLTADRILVPVAIIVALAGACVIGVELAHMFGPTELMPHRL